MTVQQPIAGVTPADEAEVPMTTVWPSVAKFAVGRFLGRLYEIRWPNLFVLRLGHAIAGACIPVSLVLYFLRVLPGTGVRYTLTNRRLVVYRGLPPKEERAIGLDRFDDVQVRVLPGQEWYHAGDLVFYRDKVETFRLQAVSRPEVFARTCLEARRAYTATQKILKEQGSAA